MIATMTVNQPTDEDDNRCTLIVVPAALLLQWKDELETKTNGMFDVHIQHGKDKIKSPARLQEKDVCDLIICTIVPMTEAFRLARSSSPLTKHSISTSTYQMTWRVATNVNT